MFRNRLSHWQFGGSRQGQPGAFVAVPVVAAPVHVLGPAALYEIAYGRAMADVRQHRTWLVAIAARVGKN